MTLNVYREKPSSIPTLPTFEIVGSLHESPVGELTFTYDNSYRENNPDGSISYNLPIDKQFFDRRDTKIFFEGLLPEERSRQEIQRAIHEDSSTYVNILKTLNCETVGALVINHEIPSFENAQYQIINNQELEDFAKNPRRTQLELSMASRLSLSGAQSKIGLYQSQEETQWYIPKGFAPSTHILKCADGTFENQIINEAICMKLAKNCNINAAEVDLIATESAPDNPILATRRFDRPFSHAEEKRRVSGLETPTRLHQEDFCQALGLPLFYKYEPTDGNYPSLITHLLDKTSSNPIADKIEFFRGLIFDYYIGNCDNHLKNRSLLWSADWKTKRLAPLYDLTSTTIYPQLDRQMGVALCNSRVIDNVRPLDITNAAIKTGLSDRMAKQVVGKLLKNIELNSEKSIHDIISNKNNFSESFKATVEDFYSELTKDAAPRIKVLKEFIDR
jgi:serine/threonine-protein kinase HipA